MDEKDKPIFHLLGFVRALQIIFNRVFRRHNIGARIVNILQRAVKCRHVLPEPVGPVTSTMPCGAVMASISFCKSPSLKPILSIDKDGSPFSRRIQMRSPFLPGKTLKRVSTSFPSAASLKVIAPSCGKRFSEISTISQYLETRDRRDNCEIEILKSALVLQHAGNAKTNARGLPIGST